MFITHLMNSEYWNRPARRLLIWLCISDFLTAVVYLFPDNDDKFCIAQSFLGIYFPVSSFLWTDCIALYVYLIISSLTRRSYLLRSYRNLFRGFHLASWGVPLICALAVLMSKHAGRSSNTETKEWCWIKSAEDDDEEDDKSSAKELFIWEIIGGKCVEWFSILVWCPILYYNCWRHLSLHEKNARLYGSMSQRQLSNSTSRQRRQLSTTSVNSTFSVDSDSGPINFTEFKRKLFYVPIIFFILRLPGSLRTISLFIYPNSSDTQWDSVLSLIQTFCDPLQGFCNGILFVTCNSNASSDSDRKKYLPNAHNEPSVESWNTAPTAPMMENDYGQDNYIDYGDESTVAGGSMTSAEHSSEGRNSNAYR